MVLRLYQASLRLGKLPKLWKTARIIALRKPQKPDYTKPKAYRPISLLPTISKGLETVIARRLSYIAETQHLLPDNHFGARPKRSAVQALFVIIEKIFDAWRRRKVLSLVSFDVQGAFNGVHPEVLCSRLIQRGAPRLLARWILDFCRERTGQLVVGGFDGPTQPIQHAGIPQGSPLSPLLYIFYNAGLVEQKITRKSGAIGFVDDYNAWAVGRTAAANLQVIQQDVIPKVTQWASKSGSVFEEDKTGLIHFSRQGQEHREDALEFGSSQIHPQSEIKVLGVTLDSKLKMTGHVAQKTAKAMRACFGLQRLKGLRPAQMRQLYRSVVLPIVDYAALAWYAHDYRGSSPKLQLLNQVQRAGGRQILRAFKTVALPVLEVEATLLPTATRLRRRTGTQLAGLYALPDDNPAKRCAVELLAQPDRYQSPAGATRHLLQKWINPKKGKDLAVEPAWVLPPWIDPQFHIHILEARAAKELLQRLRKQRCLMLYTDGSVHQKLSGSAFVYERNDTLHTGWSKLIGRATTRSVLDTELVAIAKALEWTIQNDKSRAIAVATDSQHALQALAKGNSATHSRSILRKIEEQKERLRCQKRTVEFIWIPSDSGWEGNQEADAAAKATTHGIVTRVISSETRHRDATAVGKLLLQDLEREPVYGDVTQGAGKYTWSLDYALPGSHTLPLYKALNSKEASILVQARTGKSFLNASLYQLRIAETPQCACEQGEETIQHVLLICPRWREERDVLRRAVGHLWGNIGPLLGAWNPQQDARSGEYLLGPKDKWRGNIAVVRETIRFLAATGRFESNTFRRPNSEQRASHLVRP